HRAIAKGHRAPSTAVGTEQAEPALALVIRHSTCRTSRRPTVLIAMAGLPSTGKSTLASCLESEIGAVLLGKDVVRAALFPPRVLDYSAVQDEISMSAIFQAVAAILRGDPRQAVIIDGRTFLRPGQLQPLIDLATSQGEDLFIIECVCDDDVARRRLEKDLAEGSHPAGNRT